MANSGRASWATPLALCCIFLTLLLIVGTIILALIPVYLTSRDINSNTNPQQTTLIGAYGSNLENGRSLTLSPSSPDGRQLLQRAGLQNSGVTVPTRSFTNAIPGNGKKRQVLTENPICEQPITLTGDIYMAQINIPQLSFCSSRDCQEQRLSSIQDSLRMASQIFSVDMFFTNGQTQVVQLVFCGFYTSVSVNVPTNSTTSSTSSTNTVSTLTNTVLTTTTTTTTISTNCITETINYIYLITYTNILYRFSPTTLDLTQVGTVNCSSTATNYYIALQSNGILWALAEDGTLYTYNIRTAQCIQTAFARNQSGISRFSMAFAKNDNGNGETLYISKQNDEGRVFGTINLSTLTISIIGNFNDGLYGDLSGTNDGRLYGLFADTDFIIKRINKANAQILSQFLIHQYQNKDAYAFAPYNSKFFFFLFQNNSTTIHLSDPATNTTTDIKTVPQMFYTAATSTCLANAPINITTTTAAGTTTTAIAATTTTVTGTTNTTATGGTTTTTTTTAVTTRSNCAAETKNYVYFINNNSVLYQFTPKTRQVTKVSTINCSVSESINSIAVQRNGLIWVLLTNGKLYTYSINTTQCMETPFMGNQTDITNFTMAFVNNDDDNDETLYISKQNDEGGILGTIDLTTLKISIVGNYSDSSPADLAGTPDGQLFGFFHDQYDTIKEIDKTNAAILHEYQLESPSNNDNIKTLTYFPYNSKFFIFAGYNDHTNIATFDPSTRTTTSEATVSETNFFIATVSTCLRTTTNASMMSDCITETQNYAYLINENNVLFQFSPMTLQLQEIGMINCSAFESITSIAIEHNGTIWVLYNDGNLYIYDIKTKECMETPFMSNETCITDFTMTFVKNDDDNNETLYISKLNDGGGLLGTIDLITLEVCIIGNYSNGSLADLTGTPDGRLFGLFYDSMDIIKEINKTNAEIIREYPLEKAVVCEDITSSSFFPYNSKFFIFTGYKDRTDIGIFDPMTNTTTYEGSVSETNLFIAGISTCLDSLTNVTTTTTITTTAVTTKTTSTTAVMPGSNCIAETEKYVYFINNNSVLYQFTPKTLQLTEVGMINCSSSQSINSFAVQRNGLVWVLLTNGKLYTYNINTTQCVETPFMGNQTDITDFTMAFVKNIDNNDETLYISKQNDEGGILGTIDLTTLKISIVGNFCDGSSADLAGTPDGRLFGLFHDQSDTIKEIDKTNAEILSEYRVEPPSNDDDKETLTYFPYNSKFFIFTGYCDHTDISIFDPSTRTKTYQATTSEANLFIATVSTCLRTTTNASMMNDCITETQNYAYLINENNVLFQFSPMTLQLQEIGMINCSAFESVKSIAIEHNGTIWILYSDGNLYIYDIKTKECMETPFMSNETCITDFTMTFVKNDDDNNETLYISKLNDEGGLLGTIDLITLEVCIIGNYSNGSLADLTGTPDGRLFGLFYDSMDIIKEINKTNAEIIREYPLEEAVVCEDIISSSFFPYNSTFFIFTGYKDRTDIGIFDPMTNATTYEASVSQTNLFMAAVSSCLKTN